MNFTASAIITVVALVLIAIMVNGLTRSTPPVIKDCRQRGGVPVKAVDDGTIVCVYPNRGVTLL